SAGRALPAAGARDRRPVRGVLLLGLRVRDAARHARARGPDRAAARDLPDPRELEERLARLAGRRELPPDVRPVLSAAGSAPRAAGSGERGAGSLSDLGRAAFLQGRRPRARPRVLRRGAPAASRRREPADAVLGRTHDAAGGARVTAARRTRRRVPGLIVLL